MAIYYDEENEEDFDYGFEDDDQQHFADPTGHSALRAATLADPRTHSCPTCSAPNRLTGADKALGYQCDECADRAERGYDY
jgi:hypothetical protein